MATTSTGFQAQNENYDLAAFVDLAALSAAAYSSGADLKNQLKKIGWKIADSEANASIHHEIFGTELVNAHAFVASKMVGDKEVMAISFEGTQGSADLITDFSSWGFSVYYQAIRDSIVSWIKSAYQKNVSHVYITGHSLGGAAAQIAMLDLLEESNTSIWTPFDASKPSEATLQAGDRADLTSEERAWLLSHVSAATFGAPSISADPPGLATIDAYQINPKIDLEKYKKILFQFEHKTDLYDDPIGSIGSFNTDRGDELGTLVAIDLLPEINNKYLSIVGKWSIAGSHLHSITTYQESILRIISSNPSTMSEWNSEYSENLPQIPTVFGTNGTSGNDLMHANLTATTHAGDGNDVIVVELPNSAAIDGGAGNDAFIFKTLGPQLTIDSSVSEIADSLYLMGAHTNISTEAGDQDELIIHSGGKDSGYSIRINDWYSGINNYQLASIHIVYTFDIILWKQTSLDFNALGIALFREGNNSNNSVIGSNLEADTIYGGLGNDRINGRGGNDLIYGDAVSTDSY